MATRTSSVRLARFASLKPIALHAPASAALLPSVEQFIPEMNAKGAEIGLGNGTIMLVTVPAEKPPHRAPILSWPTDCQLSGPSQLGARFRISGCERRFPRNAILLERKCPETQETGSRRGPLSDASPSDHQLSLRSSTERSVVRILSLAA